MSLKIYDTKKKNASVHKKYTFLQTMIIFYENGPVIFSYTQRRKQSVFYSMITYGCYFHLQCKFYVLG